MYFRSQTIDRMILMDDSKGFPTNLCIPSLPELKNMTRLLSKIRQYHFRTMGNFQISVKQDWKIEPMDPHLMLLEFRNTKSQKAMCYKRA